MNHEYYTRENLRALFKPRSLEETLSSMMRWVDMDEDGQVDVVHRSPQWDIRYVLAVELNNKYTVYSTTDRGVEGCKTFDCISEASPYYRELIFNTEQERRQKKRDEFRKYAEHILSSADKMKGSPTKENEEVRLMTEHFTDSIENSAKQILKDLNNLDAEAQAIAEKEFGKNI